MKHLKIVGLCLVAMFALSMAGATSALAGTGPHWEVCIKKAGGTWNNKQCSTRGAGEEWETKQLSSINETRAVEFTSGLTELTTASHSIKCLQDKGKGKIIGGSPGTDEGTIMFEKCTAKEGIIECEVRNKGGTFGTIEATVHTELAYKTKAAAEAQTPPLVDVFKNTKAAGVFVELEFSGLCGLLNGNVTATGEEHGPGISGKAGVVCEIEEPAEKYAVEHFLHCPATPLGKFFYREGGTVHEGKAELKFNNEEAKQIGQAQVELTSKEDFAVQGL